MKFGLFFVTKCFMNLKIKCVFDTKFVKMIMKNGRLYNGDTMDEIYPTTRKLESSEYKFEKPTNTTGLKD